MQSSSLRLNRGDVHYVNDVTFLYLRPLIRNARNELQADVYLPANRSLLWRR